MQGDFLTHPLDEVADYIVRTFKEWRVDQSRVVVVESLPPDDSGIAGLLRERLPLVEVLPFSIMWRHGFPTPPRSRWVTTRFHPQLIGAANGGWGVVLPVGGDHSMVDPTTLIDAGSGWVAPPDLDTVVPWQRQLRRPLRRRPAEAAGRQASGRRARSGPEQGLTCPSRAAGPDWCSVRVSLSVPAVTTTGRGVRPGVADDSAVGSPCLGGGVRLSRRTRPDTDQYLGLTEQEAEKLAKDNAFTVRVAGATASATR